MQFETAEEIAPDVWRLGGLLRGQLGTDDATAAGAEAGAHLVVLDDAVQAAGLLASEAGLLLNWRVGPAGSDLSGANFSDHSETGGVRALLPLSPVHLRAAKDGAGDVTLSWTRRGRIDADSWTASDIPLGEEREEYQVQIAHAGGAVVRTATTPAPELSLRQRRYRRRLRRAACRDRRHGAPAQPRGRLGPAGDAPPFAFMNFQPLREQMTDSKPWYLSRTIWASLITIVTAAAGICRRAGGRHRQFGADRHAAPGDHRDQRAGCDFWEVGGEEPDWVTRRQAGKDENAPPSFIPRSAPMR